VIGAVIVKAAYKNLGIPVKFEFLPGKRALAESSEGRADGEVHRIVEIGDDYPTLLWVPTPINYIEPSVFSKTLEFEVTDCSALQRYQIGIVRGVKHSQLCTQGMENVIAGDDLTGVMRMLDAERIDLVITARINGLLMAKELKLAAIKALSPPLSRFWVYHYACAGCGIEPGSEFHSLLARGQSRIGNKGRRVYFCAERCVESAPLDLF
jgi:hypothetical protein